MADARRELDLCFVLNDPWKPTLVPPATASTVSTAPIIILDPTNHSAFPTSSPNHLKAQYTFVYHGPANHKPQYVRSREAKLFGQLPEQESGMRPPFAFAWPYQPTQSQTKSECLGMSRVSNRLVGK